MPQTYIVAPDSRHFVVTVFHKFKLVKVSTRLEAVSIASQFQALGMQTTIHEEWDTYVKPALLLPLEAESLKTKNKYGNTQ